MTEIPDRLLVTHDIGTDHYKIKQWKHAAGYVTSVEMNPELATNVANQINVLLKFQTEKGCRSTNHS